MREETEEKRKNGLFYNLKECVWRRMGGESSLIVDGGFSAEGDDLGSGCRNVANGYTGPSRVISIRCSEFRMSVSERWGD